MEINPLANELRSLIKNSNIELLSFNEEEDKFILHFSINTYPIKIITDFSEYCFLESGILDMEDINSQFLNSEDKNVNYICKQLKMLSENLNKTVVQNIKLTDEYHIYQKISKSAKVVIDFQVIEKESKNLIDKFSRIHKDVSNFPKELFFNPNQILQILKKEITSINENFRHQHNIIPIDNNIYELSLKLKLNNPIIKEIKSKLGYDYIEMKISVEPKMYPFIPPKFEFVKPAIKLPLVFNLMNLKIFKIENWIPTTNLDWLISKLSEQLEKIIHEYVNLDETKFMELEILLIKLASITKEDSIEQEVLNIEFPKLIKETKESKDKYWESGTGYGHDSTKNWDITAFIKEQEIIQSDLTFLLIKIKNEIKLESIEIIMQSIMPKFLINRINGLSLLELEKSKILYEEIIKILDKMKDLIKNNDKYQGFINKIEHAFLNISDEINSLFQTNQETQENPIYLLIHCVSDWYKSNKKDEEVKTIKIINSDIKNEYEECMKKLQFANYEIGLNHRFIKEKDTKITSKQTIMRIISENSSFKKDLPLNWESTIWARVSKSNQNLFSFFISGPKDTPYENGIFEFHACFPADYPNSEPKVLLHTTGNNTVRFNPNLYNEGKVCLSILGTWSGRPEEKWQPKISSFYQVLVSIQSDILVKEPYFNEPSYERTRKTAEGIKNSKYYNEERYHSTIRWAINDMIKNPPASMEEVIKKHFTFKKDEIIKTTQEWYDNCINTTFKNELGKVRNEMIELFKTLS